MPTDIYLLLKSIPPDLQDMFETLEADAQLSNRYSLSQREKALLAHTRTRIITLCLRHYPQYKPQILIFQEYLEENYHV